MMSSCFLFFSCVVVIIMCCKKRCVVGAVCSASCPVTRCAVCFFVDMVHCMVYNIMVLNFLSF